MPTEELLTLDREETLVDNGIDTPYDITFEEEIPELAESVLDVDELSDIDDLPALVEKVVHDDDTLSVDSGLSF